MRNACVQKIGILSFRKDRIISFMKNEFVLSILKILISIVLIDLWKCVGWTKTLFTGQSPTTCGTKHVLPCPGGCLQRVVVVEVNLTLGWLSGSTSHN